MFSVYFQWASGDCCRWWSSWRSRMSRGARRSPSTMRASARSSRRTPSSRARRRARVCLRATSVCSRSSPRASAATASPSKSCSSRPTPPLPPREPEKLVLWEQCILECAYPKLIKPLEHPVTLSFHYTTHIHNYVKQTQTFYEFRTYMCFSSFWQSYPCIFYLFKKVLIWCNIL